MQRQEMLAQIIDNLEEPEGTLGSSAKFRLNYLLTRSANYIAGRFNCLYGEAYGNLVANQALYNLPTSMGETTTPIIKEIYAVSVYDNSGQLHTIEMKTIQQMDAEYAGWRLWLANTCPYLAVTTALNQFILTPAPNYASNYDPTYTTPGGYIVEGIILPGHSWDAQTAECPLPSQIHEAVVDQACLYRIDVRPTKDNIARREGLEKRLNEQYDLFETTVDRFTQATRVPSYTTGSNSGASPGFGFNPLDL